MKISDETLKELDKIISNLKNSELQQTIRNIFDFGGEIYEIADAEIEFSDESINLLEKEASTKIVKDILVLLANNDDDNIVYELHADLLPEANPYDKDDRMEAWFEGELSLDGRILYASVGEGT